MSDSTRSVKHLTPLLVKGVMLRLWFIFRSPYIVIITRYRVSNYIIHDFVYIAIGLYKVFTLIRVIYKLLINCTVKTQSSPDGGGGYHKNAGGRVRCLSGKNTKKASPICATIQN